MGKRSEEEEATVTEKKPANCFLPPPFFGRSLLFFRLLIRFLHRATDGGGAFYFFLVRDQQTISRFLSLLCISDMCLLSFFSEGGNSGKTISLSDKIISSVLCNGLPAGWLGGCIKFSSHERERTVIFEFAKINFCRNIRLFSYICPPPPDLGYKPVRYS